MYLHRISWTSSISANSSSILTRSTPRDRPGGGAELMAKCTLSVSEARFREAMRVFESILTGGELGMIAC